MSGSQTGSEMTNFVSDRKKILVCMWARSLSINFLPQQRFHLKLKLQQSKQDGAHPRNVLRILQPIRVQRAARCGPARCDGDVRSFGDARFLLGH